MDVFCLDGGVYEKDLPVPSRTTTQEVADWGIAGCVRDVGVVGEVRIRAGQVWSLIHFLLFAFSQTNTSAFKASKAKSDERYSVIQN